MVLHDYLAGISKIKNQFPKFYILFLYIFSSQTNLPHSVKEPVEILRDGVQVDNEDLESEDLTIEFDFNAIEKSKSDPAKSFEHCALAHKRPNKAKPQGGKGVEIAKRTNICANWEEALRSRVRAREEQR